MFTGMVEEIGGVSRVERLGEGRALTFLAHVVREGLALGDSVAVNGACLTVTSLGDRSFAVQAVATTLARTTLGSLSAGDAVNLERALALGARLGGHLVQGHVDAVGEVVSVRPEGEHLLIEVSVPAEIAEVTVAQGSIAIDGVSLTVNDLPRAGIVQLSIIPFTLAHTTLSALRPGQRVNVEG
ncbi:MAG: riboflavin synthase, partial [Gemmatimonadota bacterium]|nr:riboflavin synthase [Gemmatimonadota bacterium]